MKKLTAFSLVIFMVLSMLAACGSNSQSAHSKDSANAPTHEGQGPSGNGEVTVYLVSQVVNYGTKYNYVYDEKGVLTVNPVVGGDLRDELEYDADYKLIKKTRIQDGKQKSYWQYIYNEQGILVQRDQHGTDDSVGMSEVYTYNDQGLVDTINKSFIGKPHSEVKYTYNSNGQVTEEKEVFTRGDIYTTTYTYDDKGNLVEYNYNGTTKKNMTFTYDENGNRLTEKNVDNGSETTLTYNSDGQLIEENYQGSNTRRYVYHYDAQGNLIRKERFENGSEDQPIEYYYTAVTLSAEDAERALKIMNEFMTEQGLTPLLRTP